jgi:Flp pilus assembly pilin Flp
MQTGGVRARALSWRFYLEVVLGSVGVLLFVLTLVWKDWIELVFRVDPDEAQGLVEYGLIIALVAVLAIAGLIVFGPAVSSLLSKLGGSV